METAEGDRRVLGHRCRVRHRHRDRDWHWRMPLRRRPTIEHVLAFSPDQQYLYVGGGKGISVVDPKTLTYIGIIQPAGIIGGGHHIHLERIAHPHALVDYRERRAAEFLRLCLCHLPHCLS